MSLSCTFAIIRCPSCGEPVMPSSIEFGKEPALMTVKCPHCRKTIEAKRDPASGELKPKVANPS